MNVLVAGATGAIGRPLISALVSARHNVFGMTSSKLGLQTLKEDGAEGLLANALDAEAVDAAIKRARPEVVIDELTSLPTHRICRIGSHLLSISQRKMDRCRESPLRTTYLTMRMLVITNETFLTRPT